MRDVIHDTVLDIRSETETTGYTVIRLRCGRCGHEREIRNPVYAAPDGCPPMPAIPRTSRCTRCGRVCRTDSAVMPEVNPW